MARGLSLPLLVASVAAYSFTASPASDLQPLFGIVAPYLGADVSTSFSVPSVSPSFYLWLHGDTLLGAFNGSAREWSGLMPRNSVGVLNVSSTGSVLSSTEAHFIRPGAGNALHDGFWSPPGNKSQWYWPTAGLTLNGRAYVAAMRMEMGPPGLFPFQYAGWDIISLGAPTSADPLEWASPSISTLPHINATFSVGNAVMDGGDGYIYMMGTTGSPASAIMTRISEASFESAAWDGLQYFTRGAWSSFDARVPPDTLFDIAPSEATLVRHALGFFYILTVNTFVSDSVMIRTAPRPEGPWTDNVPFYKIPADQLSGGAFCYAGKAHPGSFPHLPATRHSPHHQSTYSVHSRSPPSPPRPTPPRVYT